MKLNLQARSTRLHIFSNGGSPMILHDHHVPASRALRLVSALPVLCGALYFASATPAAAYPNYGMPPTNAWYPAPTGFEGFQLTPPYNTENPFNAAQLQTISNGFDLFTNETFDGNGRTCATCHLSDKNYNISVEDFQSLPPDKQELVLGGTNPDLENEEAVIEKMLFNINQSAGPGTEGTIAEPLGPFRASMAIGGLGFTVLNDYVCLGDGAPVNSPQGNPCLIGGPSPGNATIDDGIRDIMLGWSGEGSLAEAFPWWNGSGLEHADCDGIIEEFAADRSSLRDLDLALATFTLAAVKTHFPVTQNREPGVDFRCPTADELLDMAAFQKWLGRRFELDITKLKFKTARARNGRNLFSTRVATCVSCHANASASDTQGRVKAGPVPFLTKTGAPDFHEEAEDLYLIGTNKASRNGSQLLELDLLDQFQTFTLPFDKGDHQLRGGQIGVDGVRRERQGGFNVQSLIEAVRNKQFFHHNGIEGSIEDAIEFYFTDDFRVSQGGTAVSNVFRRKNPAVPNVLYTPAEARAFLGGDQAIRDMGLFLRSLAAIYAFADCERFIDEMADRAVLGLPLKQPADHCRFALADVKRILTEVQVPSGYGIVLLVAASANATLTNAEKTVSPSNKLKMLKSARGQIAAARRAIATTPELY